VRVTLTWGEFYQAALIAAGRQARAILKGRKETYGHPVERGSWDAHVEGAAAELACAKALGLYWGDSPELDYDGDVGRLYVRSTDLEHGCLLIYEDNPDGLYVLAVGKSPTFDLVGFAHTRDAKHERYWDTTRLRVSAWMVPQADLTPFDELRS
jgi:hypothetical protein